MMISRIPHAGVSAGKGSRPVSDGMVRERRALELMGAGGAHLLALICSAGRASSGPRSRHVHICCPLDAWGL